MLCSVLRERDIARRFGHGESGILGSGLEGLDVVLVVARSGLLAGLESQEAAVTLRY